MFYIYIYIYVNLHLLEILIYYPAHSYRSQLVALNPVYVTVLLWRKTRGGHHYLTLFKSFYTPRIEAYYRDRLTS